MIFSYLCFWFSALIVPCMFTKCFPSHPFHCVSFALEDLTVLANNCLLFCTSVFAEVSEMSNRLSNETKMYADKAKDLNRQVIHVHNAYAMNLSI
jgi:hypothetical protein